MDREQRKEIMAQVGVMTILGISGGRVIATNFGIDLPVTDEIMVSITLMPSDTYTVMRMGKRDGVWMVLGVRDNIYFDQLSEVAWRCSCWESYSDTEW